MSFGRGHRQIGGTQLGELAGQAVAMQWQKRIAASRDDKPEAGRPPLDNHVQAFEDPRVMQDMGVVEDEHERIAGRREVEEQRLEQIGNSRRRPRDGQVVRRRPTAAQGGDEESLKVGWLVIRGCEGNPGDGGGQTACPVAEEHRLARPRSCRHQGEGLTVGGIESGGKAGPGHEAGRLGRKDQTALRERAAHSRAAAERAASGPSMAGRHLSRQHEPPTDRPSRIAPG